MNAYKLWLPMMIVGAFTLQGCQNLEVAPVKTRNQFQSPPKDLMTRPTVREFLTPFQRSVTKFEQRFENSETKLQDSLKSARPTPTR